MEQNLSIRGVLGEAIALLHANSLMTLGLMSAAYAVGGFIAFFTPESMMMVVNIGTSIALSFVALVIVAVLLVNTGTSPSPQARLQEVAARRFGLYFLYSVIFALAAGLIIGLIVAIAGVSLGQALMNLLDAFAIDAQLATGDLEQTAQVWASLGEQSRALIVLTFAAAGLCSFLAINLLATLWLLVPARMVACDQGLGAMGASARLIRPVFWRAYVLSLITWVLAISAVALPLYLIWNGVIAPGAEHIVLSRVLQSITAAFA